MMIAGTMRALRAAGIKPRRRKVPRQLPPDRIEEEYARRLMTFVTMAERAHEPLLTELPGLLERAARERGDGARADVGEGERIRRLVAEVEERIRRQLNTRELEQLAEVVAERTAIHHRAQFSRQIQAAIGVDVLGGDPQLAGIIDGFTAENVALIRDIPLNVARRVEGIVTRGVSSGKLWKDVAKDIEDEWGIGRRRARLIGRDQVGKFYGQVNGTRQKALGIDGYIWRGVLDRRERDEHVAREGNRYSWDKPPAGGRHPGEEILCRCIAEPDFASVLGARPGGLG